NDVDAVLFHRARASAAEQEALSRFLSDASASGALVPVGVEGTGTAESLVFASRRAAGKFPASDAGRRAVMDALAHPVASPVKPQGWYYEPQNGATFSGSTV